MEEKEVKIIGFPPELSELIGITINGVYYVNEKYASKAKGLKQSA